MKVSLELLGLVLSAVIAIVGAMWWMINQAFKKGASDQKVQDAHDKIKDYDKKSVECEKKFVRLEERKADNKAIDDIRMDISLMRTDLKAMLSGNVTGTLVQAHSPIALTEMGRQIAEEMGMEELVKKNWSKIHALLDENIASRNPYDIQQFCIDWATAFPERFFSDEDIEFFKNYAYNKGKPLAYYGSLIGVMIRDRYFEYKGIDVDDIDRHDPAKK